MAYNEVLSPKIALSPARVARLEAEANRKRDRAGSFSNLFSINENKHTQIEISPMKMEILRGNKYELMDENHAPTSAWHRETYHCSPSHSKTGKSDTAVRVGLPEASITTVKSKLHVLNQYTSSMADSEKWFRHDHSDEPDLNKAIFEESISMDDTANTSTITDICKKCRTFDSIKTPQCRCGGDWFVDHDHLSESADNAPRPLSRKPRDGEPDPTRRIIQESECWFDYDANRKFTSPKPRVRLDSPQLIERSRGSEMRKIFGLD